MDMPSYLTPKQFCSRYSLSIATLYRLIAAGKIEACKVGRATRIPLAQAEDYFLSLPKLETRGKYTRH